MSGRTVAVIGCGSIGMRHIRNLRAFPRTRVVACDVDEARRSVATEAGATAVAAIPDLDAYSPADAIVCTTTDRHVADTLWALRAGCNVLVEKPLALDSRGAEEIVGAATRAGRRVTVGYMLRCDPALRRLRAAVHGRELGPVRLGSIAFGQYLPDWRAARDYRDTPSAKRAKGGGILLEASHEIDLLLWLFGTPRALRAGAYRVSELEIDVEDTIAAIVEMDDGAVVEVHLDFVERGYRREIRAATSLGLLGWGLKQGAFAHGAGNELWREPACDIDRLYQDELAAFLDGSDDVASVADGLRVMRVIDAIRASSESGCRVSLA